MIHDIIQFQEAQKVLLARCVAPNLFAPTSPTHTQTAPPSAKPDERRSSLFILGEPQEPSETPLFILPEPAETSPKDLSRKKSMQTKPRSPTTLERLPSDSASFTIKTSGHTENGQVSFNTQTLVLSGIRNGVQFRETYDLSVCGMKKVDTQKLLLTFYHHLSQEENPDHKEKEKEKEKEKKTKLDQTEELPSLFARKKTEKGFGPFAYLSL